MNSEKRKDIIIGVLVALVVLSILVVGGLAFVNSHEDDVPTTSTTEVFERTLQPKSTKYMHMELATTTLVDVSSTSESLTSKTKKTTKKSIASTTLSPRQIFTPVEGELESRQYYRNTYFGININFGQEISLSSYSTSDPTNSSYYRELNHAKNTQGDEITITIFNDLETAMTDDDLLTTNARRNFSRRTSEYSNTVYDQTEVTGMAVKGSPTPVIYGSFEGEDGTKMVLAQAYIQKGDYTMCIEFSTVDTGNTFDSVQNFVDTKL